jgi:large subunit ribosomal protein L22
MTGAKTNERPGTRAKVSHVRVSAYKAREVLNQIRDLPVGDAADYLDLCERGVADVISKLLDSAVANAEHNDLQDAEELFVSACYADEGPTMKRWRPRARGRATRIRKRTCHITIIVSRMDDGALELRREKLERRASGSAPKASRAARVAKSKGEEAPVEDASDEVDETSADEDVASGGIAAPQDGDHPYGDGSHAPLDDAAEMPEGYPVKGNADSGKFHQPDGRWYENTVAEVWFADAAAAEAAGFIEAGTKAKTSDSEEEE